jgi:hypothetical protein
MKPIALKCLVAAVGIGALAGTALLPRGDLAESAPTLMLLLALAGLAGSRSVRIPGLRIQVTAADMFTFCALATLQPAATPLVALAGVLGAMIGPRRRPLSLRTVFNLGSVTVSAAAAAHVYTMLGGTTSALSGHASLVLLTCAAVFLATNLALVAAAVRLETGRGVVLTITTVTPCAAVACLTSALLAMGMSLTLAGLGPLAAFLGLACTGPLVAYFKAHRQRLEDLSAAAGLQPTPSTVEI